MNIQPDAFFEALTRVIREQPPFARGLRSMTQWCAQNLPHRDWDSIMALDVSRDDAAARAWIPGVLDDWPCPFEVRALYFGLAEDCDPGGAEFAKLYVAFMGQYDPTDEKAGWVFGALKHYPPSGTLGVDTLKTAGLLFNRKDEERLGADGHFTFSLAYALLLVTSIMSARLYRRLGTTAPEVGLLVGWDSGDCMVPGVLTPAGFVPNQRAMI